MKTLLAIAYRSLVLSVAEATGRACSWLSGEWRPFVLWFGVVAVAISAVQYLMGNPVWEWRALARGILSGLPVSWWKILLAFILSVVLWLSWQARRRVVVEAFTDNASLGAEVKGLSTLLMVDLAKIRDLYSHVDEQRAIPTEFEVNAPFDTLIKVEDVSDFLQNAVNADYKISIPGGLELPLGALMAIAGRIVKGPRIIGSVYKDG